MTLLPDDENVYVWDRIRPGDPAMRAGCCDLRPAQFPNNLKLDEVPELRSILVSAGHMTWVKYFDCTVCGQEWQIMPTEYGKSWDFILQKSGDSR